MGLLLDTKVLKKSEKKGLMVNYNKTESIIVNKRKSQIRIGDVDIKQ